MAETKPTDIPGVEVTEHWNLTRSEESGNAYWGCNDGTGYTSVVDGARKFNLQDYEKERFVALGGRLVPPDILDFGDEDSVFAEGGVIYGVVMPPTPLELTLIRGEKARVNFTT